MQLKIKDPLESKKYLFVFLVIASILISGLSIDIYTPSLPAVTAFYHTDKALVQFTITSYLLGFALAQLIAGSLSDSWGRKSILIGSLGLYCVISLMVPIASSIYQLQFLRLIQGIGVAFINVSIRAIIADLFEGSDFYKMMNYVAMAWAIGPIIAPAIGGHLQDSYGWHASFYFLAAYSFLLFALSSGFFIETIKTKRPYNSKELFHCYGTLLRHSDFLLGLICLGLLYALLVIFAVVAPFIIQEKLHFAPVQFGYMSLMMGSMWFFGNITNRFLQKIRIRTKVRTCFFLMFCISLLMVYLSITETLTIYIILAPTGCLFYLGGLVFPNYFAQNIALFQDMAGYANGLMGAGVVIMAGLGSSVGMMLRSTSLAPLALAYLMIATICLLCSFRINHREIVVVSAAHHYTR